MKIENMMSKKEEFTTASEFCFVELVGAGAYKLLQMMSKGEIETLLEDYQDIIDKAKVGDIIRIERVMCGIPYIIRFRKETEECEEMLQNLRTSVCIAD